jgi:hypothetical protein
LKISKYAHAVSKSITVKEFDKLIYQNDTSYSVLFI